MVVTLQSYLAPLSALVALLSMPDAVFSQLPGADGLVPEACLLEFDGALDCVLENIFVCAGIIDLADSLPMLAEEIDSCESAQTFTCAIYEACEPCDEQFEVFLGCTLSAIDSGEMTLRQGSGGMEMPDCMNMTMVDDMILEECMNMTDSGAIDGAFDLDLDGCDLGPEACA